MSENKRPVSRTTGTTVKKSATGTTVRKPAATASGTTVRRPASTASGTTVRRPASTASGTTVRKTAAAPVRRTSSTGTGKPAARPGAKQPVRRTAAQKSGFPGNIDIETLIAYVLIAAVLAGIIALAILGIRRCDKSTTTYQNADITANIHPVETEVPVQTADNPFDTGSDNNNALITDTPTSEPTAQTVNNGMRSATIRWIGDFVISKDMIGDAKLLAASTGSQDPYEFHPWLSYIKGEMGNADFSVANVDGPMGGEKMRSTGYTGYPQFNTPEYLMSAIKDTGVDMLTLANNHMLDTYYDGLMSEIEKVEQYGFLHIGANRSQEEKATPYIHEINGIKVGFLNYTYSVNDIDRLVKGLNPNAMKFGVNATKNSNVGNDARALREAGAEIIICFMHWGTEYETTPDANQAYLAKNLVAAGVDVIMGSHPHVVQKAEWLSGTNQFGEQQKTLCLYSVGNYLTDHTKTNTDGGIIFEFTIREKGDHTFEVTSPSYLPVYVWKTGNEISGRNYYVVNAAKYVRGGSRPNGMSDSDYAKMKASYDHSVQVMSTGVGNIIYE